MAAYEDVLATRLQLLGVGGYVAGFQQVTDALGLFDSKLSTVQARQLSLGFAAGAVAAGAIAFLGNAAKAAGEDTEIFNRAAANFKGSFPSSEISDFTGQLEQVTGIADDSIASFLGLLGTFQITGEAAKGLAEPILNAAEALKAQGVTTEQLAVQVGKAIQTGDAGPLRRVGIIIDDVGFKSKSTAERATAMQAALNAQGGATAARDAMNTLGGSLRAAQTAAGSFVEAFGAPLVGPLTEGAKLTTQIAYSFQRLPGPLQTCITLLGVVAVGALTVYSGMTIFAVTQTVRLAKAQLEAAVAADKMATANTRAGNAAATAAGKGATKGAGLAGNFLAGGKVAAGVGIADFALQFVPDTFAGGAGRVAKDIGNDAAIGAGLGSIFGPRGALLGALLGGGAGVAQNVLGGGKKDESAEALKQIAANTAKTADNTDPSKLPLGTGVIPGARQVGALEMRRFLT